LPDIIRAVIDESGIKNEYKDDEERLGNLDKIVLFAESRKNKDIKIHEFLNLSSFEPDINNDNDNTVDKVKLMTVHKSKDFEFEAVFIAGLEDGLFPYYKDKEDEDERIEEERRLMYVAITRAKKELYLIYCQKRFINNETKFLPKSRFIEEIPAKLIQEIK